MPRQYKYPDTPLGRAADMLGGYAQAGIIIARQEQRPEPRSRNSIRDMAQEGARVHEAVAIAVELATQGRVRAAEMHPWLSNVRLGKVAA